MAQRKITQAQQPVNTALGTIKRHAFETQNFDLMDDVQSLSDKIIIYTASATGLGSKSGYHVGAVLSCLDMMAKDLSAIDLNDPLQNHIEMIADISEKHRIGDINHRKIINNMADNIRGYSNALEITKLNPEIIDQVERATKKRLISIQESKNSEERYQNIIKLASASVSMRQIYESDADVKIIHTLVEGKVIGVLSESRQNDKIPLLGLQ